LPVHTVLQVSTDTASLLRHTPMATAHVGGLPAPVMLCMGALFCLVGGRLTLVQLTISVPSSLALI